MVLTISLFTSLTPMVYTWWRFAGWYAWTQAEKDIKHRANYNSHYYSLYGRTLSNNKDDWKPSSDIWCGGYTLGFLVGLIWPLVPFFFLIKKVHRIDGGVSYVPKHIRDERHEQLLRNRIYELEREAGIR